MKYRELLATFVLAIVSSLMLAGCTQKPEQVLDDTVDYAEETPVLVEVLEQSEIPETIPTTGIRAESTEDQNLIDELNQFQDKSLETNFSEIESQL